MSIIRFVREKLKLIMSYQNKKSHLLTLFDESPVLEKLPPN